MMLDNVERHLDLSFNNKLQYIHFILPEFIGAMRGDFAVQCRALSAFALILSRVASPALREVILSEGPEHVPRIIDAALLPGVVAALIGKQFAHVQKVAFPPLCWGPGELAAKEYLKAKLSEWDRKGVLVFENVRGYYSEMVGGDFDEDEL